MPRYEYQCTNCGKKLEVNQRMSDAPLTDCDCGQPGTLKRLLSAGSGLIFKGTGFYQTDYKGGSKSSDAPVPTSTDAAPAAKPAEAPKASGGHSCGTGCGCA